jgi:hypothetical protein
MKQTRKKQDKNPDIGKYGTVADIIRLVTPSREAQQRCGDEL